MALDDNILGLKKTEFCYLPKQKNQGNSFIYQQAEGFVVSRIRLHGNYPTATNMDHENQLKDYVQQVEEGILQLLPSIETRPSQLHSAISIVQGWRQTLTSSPIDGNE